ncbi:MAG: PEP/pyruvate-binding domain-containing protein, partial [Gaiellaceae bacterium]
MTSLAPTTTTRTTFVYAFDEPDPGGRELLGGKGLGLSEMAHLGVPVPAGFTITTDACRAYLAGDGELPDGLEQQLAEHIERLERATGAVFGDPSRPLLVSVRSGAAISMPGMMDTILDLGLNDEAVHGLAAATGSTRFAHDSYRRLIQMYGSVVEGIDSHKFEDALAALRAERGVESDVDLTAPDLQLLIERYKQIYLDEAGGPFPADAHEQLLRAVRAVFESWNSPRARVYRQAYEIPDDLGTAVNVMQMVFGNKGDDCGTGVCFSRDPSTGERGLCGEFLLNAQGEDVVAGIRLPVPLEEMRASFPAGFAELEQTVDRLERHYRDVQDIEFTVEQ